MPCHHAGYEKAGDEIDYGRLFSYEKHTVLSHKQEQLRLLYIDSLTSIYNRRYYDEHFQGADDIQAMVVIDVDNFKHMSKIESGKLTLTTDQISLKEVVEGIVNIMQPQIKAKRQTFNIHVENILTENVWCDGVRLNQVLLNLLSNSTKYTPEGGSIQLSLSEEKSPKGENYIRIHIKVKDNGIGMSPDFLKRIYEPYSRADGVRVSKTQGTGLGMAITKYIVEAMEG